MMKVTSRLSIILVNFNGCDVLRDCLASIEKSQPQVPHVIVVDNGSTDDSVQMVRCEFPSVDIIETGVNLGFAGGNNVGIRAALDAGAPYILLLNNDTLVDPSCFAEMLQVVESDPQVGAVTPLILFAEPKDRIWCAGGGYNLWYGMARHYGMRHHCSEARYLVERDVSFATGCAVLLRAEALRQIGFLDESLFAYHEDAELSFRLNRAGWRIRYNPRAIIWHREGWVARRSIGQQVRIHLCVRNILRVHRRYAASYHSLTFWPCFLWRWVLLASMNALLHGRFDTVRGIFSGIRGYFRGEIGKPELPP